MTSSARPAVDVGGLEGQLEEVREALMADARINVDRILAEAREEAERLVAATERDADAEVDRERERSKRSAGIHADQVLARARADAHARIQRAREEVRQQLVDEVRAATGGARTDPRYPALLDQLEVMARSQLGDRTVIERDPEGRGGIIATRDTRRVDYTLGALADRARDAISDEVAQLWT